MFIKMWLHFMLYKKYWCNDKIFAFQCEGERFKFLFLQLINPSPSLDSLHG